MLLALSTGRSIRARSKYAHCMEERKIVCLPCRCSLCHRRNGLTFELGIASLNLALAKDALPDEPDLRASSRRSIGLLRLPRPLLAAH